MAMFKSHVSLPKGTNMYQSIPIIHTGMCIIYVYIYICSISWSHIVPIHTHSHHNPASWPWPTTPPNLQPEPHVPRSRWRSQVSTNHLANGRCPRSTALCRAVCPEDCGRVRESPGDRSQMGMKIRKNWGQLDFGPGEINHSWLSFMHIFVDLSWVYPFIDGLSRVSVVIQVSLAILNCWRSATLKWKVKCYPKKWVLWKWMLSIAMESHHKMMFLEYNDYVQLMWW